MARLVLAGDTPRSRPLAAVLALVLACLAGAPFLFPGTVAYRAASTICIFVLLAASYDMLLGYTAIVSFAHTMFYGIGAYAVGITLQYLPPSWDSVLLGVAAGLVLSLALALVIGLLSLRVRTIFFAMVTLAVASAFATLVSKLYHITGGEDGLNVMVPALVSPATHLLHHDLRGFDILGWLGTVVGHPGAPAAAARAAVFRVRASGALLMYYLLFASSLALFLIMLRLVNSPFGRVLQAVRENEFRAQALGYRTVLYRTTVTCMGALVASLAGSLLTLSLQYIDPGTTLSFGLMIDILVMTVIGGMGTLYGAVVGATIFVIAQNYLRAGLSLVAATPVGHVPLLGSLVAPDRWMLWLGLLFVLSVYFFPQGIVGQLRLWARGRRPGAG
ncbi:MAG TPA: branched-chain amino acid ABC transporter permease [Gammaproteobacteria bacterium]|nr:branched-chain amino acid ABC transporter permease [Gammaproteobacteria bacterium]